MGFINQTTVATGSPDLVVPNVPCDTTVSIGDWVIMSGGIAVKALADNSANSNVLGLVESKNSSTSSNVRVMGVSSPIFNGLDETQEYYLSDNIPGGMNSQGNGVPTATGHVVLKLGQPYNSTQFLVLKGSRMVRS